MDLKELLGEELAAQVTEKLGDKKLMLDDGKMIPKSRLDEVIEQKNGYKTQVEALNTELTGLKKSVKDNEGATAKITELQDAIAKKDAENLTIQKKYALREELSRSGAKYSDLLESKFDLGKIELDADGKVKDAENLIKPYKESYKELFGEIVVKGADVREGSNPKPGAKFTREQVSKMTQAEVTANLKAINESMASW